MMMDQIKKQVLDILKQIKDIELMLEKDKKMNEKLENLCVILD